MPNMTALRFQECGLDQALRRVVADAAFAHGLCTDTSLVDTSNMAPCDDGALSVSYAAHLATSSHAVADGVVNAIQAELFDSPCSAFRKEMEHVGCSLTKGSSKEAAAQVLAQPASIAAHKLAGAL